MSGSQKSLNGPARIVTFLSTRIHIILENVGHIYECLVTEFRYRGYPLEMLERITRARINALYFTHEFYEKLKKTEPDLFRFVLEGHGYLSEYSVCYAKAQEAIADWSGFEEELEDLLPSLRGNDKKIVREAISQIRQSIAVMASVRPGRVH